MQTGPNLIDENILASNTGDDVPLAIEIMGLFKEQSQIWSRMLDADLPQKQWADAAHSLKGSALGAGAVPLADACSRAEKRGRAEDPVSRTEAAILLSEIKDLIGPSLEAAATLSFKLNNRGHFSASNASNS